VQRYIAKDGLPANVYMPDTVNTNGEFNTSLRTLVGNYTIRKLTWDQFRVIVWPQGLTVNQALLPAWASANLGTGRNQDQHDPVPMVEHVAAPDLLEVRRQFQDDMKVYRYGQWTEISDQMPDEEVLLLRPFDMREAGQQVVGGLAFGSGCVLQALEDFGVNVPNTQNSTAAAWHLYCQQNNIDYRTDSHYIRFYVGTLHYRLRNNVAMRWEDIDWATMGGDGNYLVSTYPYGAPMGNATGHMIGVVVNGGAAQTIHDQQQLTEPRLDTGTVHVRYIFRM
jgi:hypothetical protein